MKLAPLLLLVGLAGCAIPRHEGPPFAEGGPEGALGAAPGGAPLFERFVAVEPGILFVAAGIPQGSTLDGPALFEALRSRGIRTVVVAGGRDELFWKEEGYLRWWSEATGFRIAARHVDVDPEKPWGTDDRSALRVAAEAVIAAETGRGPVLVHGDPAVPGIVAAAWELRRRGPGAWDGILAKAEQKDPELRERLAALRSELTMLARL